ncbi:hypothetical protein CAPTEDRAFT_187294 [Capitella teleta]|uniref:Apple domain-containing protein n=1 Tax=Capitella teleta TaxID=283909 RepID=X1ZK48_CAPTE|nr:hypothetical protein CAPTEDRAFT_187294 [Capitella teleta]|eukprot:ELU10129.1 hypothetical protein CAPTEDRAFT_187294 [Capitella teleta]
MERAWILFAFGFFYAHAEITDDGSVILTNGANSTMGSIERYLAHFRFENNVIELVKQDWAEDSCLRRFPGSRQRDGDFYVGQSEMSCRALCFGRTDCAGATFNDITGSCFVHLSTGRVSHYGDPCCVHYKRIVCPVDESGRPFSLEALNISAIPRNNTGVLTRQSTANDVTPDRPHCVLTFNNSKQEGGEIVGNTSEEECKALCRERTTCSAYSHRREEDMCVLHERTNVESHVDAPGYMHGKKVQCFNDSLPDNGRQECRNITRFTLHPMSNQDHGERVPGIRDSNSCRLNCINDSQCSAFDFHLYESSCWSHAMTSESSQSPNYCCNHYKKTRICQYDCFDVLKNSKVNTLDGIIINTDNETVCRQHCLIDNDCLAFAFSESVRLCMKMTYVVHDGSRTFHSEYSYWRKKECKRDDDDDISYQQPTTTSTSPPPTTPSTSTTTTQSSNPPFLRIENAPSPPRRDKPTFTSFIKEYSTVTDRMPLSEYSLVKANCEISHPHLKNVRTLIRVRVRKLLHEITERSMADF